MAVCITMFFGRGGSAIATNTLGFLIELSCQSTFVVFASISVGNYINFNYFVNLKSSTTN